MVQSNAAASSIPRSPHIYARTYAGMPSDDDRGFVDDARVLARIIRLAMRYRVRLTLAVSATIAAAAFQLMIPRLLGDAVDGALGLLAGGSVDRAAAEDALMLCLQVFQQSVDPGCQSCSALLPTHRSHLHRI